MYAQRAMCGAYPLTGHYADYSPDSSDYLAAYAKADPRVTQQSIDYPTYQARVDCQQYSRGLLASDGTGAVALAVH